MVYYCCCWVVRWVSIGEMSVEEWHRLFTFNASEKVGWFVLVLVEVLLLSMAGRCVVVCHPSEKPAPLLFLACCCWLLISVNPSTWMHRMVFHHDTQEHEMLLMYTYTMNKSNKHESSLNIIEKSQGHLTLPSTVNRSLIYSHSYRSSHHICIIMWAKKQTLFVHCYLST